MKTTFKLLVGLLAINIIIIPMMADFPFSQSNISPRQWEQPQEGVSVALILHDHFITIYIKNTSKTLKDVLTQRSEPSPKLFYIDGHGMKIPLGDHKTSDNLQNDIADTSIGHEGPVGLPSGQIMSRIITINSDELALIKTHPIACTLLIYDPITKQKITIKSSPKILTEIPQ